MAALQVWQVENHKKYVSAIATNKSKEQRSNQNFLYKLLWTPMGSDTEKNNISYSLDLLLIADLSLDQQ